MIIKKFSVPVKRKFASREKTTLSRRQPEHKKQIYRFTKAARKPTSQSDNERTTLKSKANTPATAPALPLPPRKGNYGLFPLLSFILFLTFPAKCFIKVLFRIFIYNLCNHRPTFYTFTPCFFFFKIHLI